MWRQEADAAQVNPALGERGQDSRRPARGPDGLDALGGSVLGQPQLADAVGEHRGIRRRQVELARVELGDMRHHVGCGGAFPRNERREIAAQRLVGQMRQRVALHERTPRRGLGVEGLHHHF